MTLATRNVPTHDDETLLSPEEVRQALGLGRTATYQLLWAGTIPSFRLGRLRKIKRSELEIYIAALAELEEGERD